MVKYTVWLTKIQGERRETSTDEALMREGKEMGKKNQRASTTCSE